MDLEDPAMGLIFYRYQLKLGAHRSGPSGTLWEGNRSAAKSSIAVLAR